MIKFKKNIWLLFYFIVFIATALLVMAVYQKYEEILESTKSDQLHHLHSYDNRLDALFREQEILQNVLADKYLNLEFDHDKFNTILDLNPLFIGLFIVSKEGELRFTTLPDLILPNLLQDKNTKQWFQETFNSNQMVIGKAYYLEHINKWILPVRKRILDGKGNIVAVISNALDLTMLHRMWDEVDNLNNIMQVTLDNGVFPILRSSVTTELYAQYYGHSQPDKRLYGQQLSRLKAQLAAQKISYSQPMIYNSEEPETEKLIYTLRYNARYNFWTSAETPYHLVLQKLYQQGFYYFVFYLLLIVIIFTLFSWVIKNEIKKIDELTYHAEHDELTGLVKFTVLNKYMGSIQSMDERPFALLYIDLDNFKNINDTFGHSYGDIILVKVAKRILKSLLSYKGRACRYHGDEFVIFVEYSDKTEITQFAALLLKTISQPYVIKQNNFKISASIGIACFPEHSRDMETLLCYAGHSLFMAKKTKNQHQFFSKSLHHQLQQNLVIELSLYQAVLNQEITLVYQPQLDSDNKLFGVEALVRWHHKELGFIAPDVFIPIAEKSGFMPQLGLYIMHKAMQEIALLKQQENLAFKLSINVSIRQFMKIDFMTKLIEACKSHAIDPATVTIEITESLFIERLDNLLPLFHSIKTQGFSLSMDDFGTGYSSLSMLKKVPIDELKIDKSFVDHIVTNQADMAMVENIIKMGKALGMHIVAEGVEESQQVALLKKAGCDIFQGYYFSKPLAIEELKIFAEKHQRSMPQLGNLQKIA